MHIRWRGMELPSALEVDRDTLTETYGKFSADFLSTFCILTT